MNLPQEMNLIDLPEAARLAGVSEAAVCRMHRLGLFPQAVYVEVGDVKLVRFRRTSIEKWIAEGRPRVALQREADWVVPSGGEGC